MAPPRSPSSTVDEAVRLIRDRIKELDSERSQLKRALASLTPDRRRRQPNSRGTTHRTVRRPGKASRADQALKAVQQSPGLSASEIAKKLKVQPNHVYRVLAKLVKDGRVRKDGRTYHPA